MDRAQPDRTIDEKCDLIIKLVLENKNAIAGNQKAIAQNRNAITRVHRLITDANSSAASVHNQAHIMMSEFNNVSSQLKRFQQELGAIYNRLDLVLEQLETNREGRRYTMSQDLKLVLEGLVESTEKLLELAQEGNASWEST